MRITVKKKEKKQLQTGGTRGAGVSVHTAGSVRFRSKHRQQKVRKTIYLLALW